MSWGIPIGAGDPELQWNSCFDFFGCFNFVILRGRMLRAMYDLQLQHMIRPGRAVVGEFSAGEMYFAAANMANKVHIRRILKCFISG